ncbi:hypothetical protein K438DRAFT_1933515 [Mycena galopus ATCC 62051]|nr:hypothetical protein K438DRAFT_1933515 [Mycena galopus ATCC 62051]
MQRRRAPEPAAAATAQACTSVADTSGPRLWANYSEQAQMRTLEEDTSASPGAVLVPTPKSKDEPREGSANNSREDTATALHETKPACSPFGTCHHSKIPTRRGAGEDETRCCRLEGSVGTRTPPEKAMAATASMKQKVKGRSIEEGVQGMRTTARGTKTSRHGYGDALFTKDKDGRRASANLMVLLRAEYRGSELLLNCVQLFREMTGERDSPLYLDSYYASATYWCPSCSTFSLLDQTASSRRRPRQYPARSAPFARYGQWKVGRNQFSARVDMDRPVMVIFLVAASARVGLRRPAA